MSFEPVEVGDGDTLLKDMPWERKEIAKIYKECLDLTGDLRHDLGLNNDASHSTILSTVRKLYDKAKEWRLEKTLEGDVFSDVLSVAFSPGDGARIALGSTDNTVQVWNVATGLCMAKLEGHSDYVTSVAFSPGEGARIASGSDDKTVRVWDAATGECVAVLLGHSDHVISVAFSPDGKLVASGSEDDTVRVWEVATSKCMPLQTWRGFGVSSVAFSPDDKLVASSRSSTLQIFKLGVYDLNTI